MTNWEAIHQSRHWGTYPSEYMVRLVRQFMSGRSGDVAALDIGCGAGAHSWMMDREGMSVTAIDISPTAVARLGTIAPGAKIYVGDIVVAEWAPASFDFIMDNLTLTHVERPPMDKIRSWLKPNGWLVSAVFSETPDGTPENWNHHLGAPVERITRSVTGIGTYEILVQKYEKPLA